MDDGLDLLPVGVVLDDELLDGRPEDALSQLHGRLGVIPRRPEVLGEALKGAALVVGEGHVVLLGGLETRAGLLEGAEALVDPLLECVGDEPVLRIAEVELLEGPLGFVLAGLHVEVGSP